MRQERETLRSSPGSEASMKTADSVWELRTAVCFSAALTEEDRSGSFEAVVEAPGELAQRLLAIGCREGQHRSRSRRRGRHLFV